jgi:hypothetical protein
MLVNSIFGIRHPSGVLRTGSWRGENLRPRSGEPATSDIQVRALLPHPFDEVIWSSHGGKTALFDQRPVREQSRLFDFTERYGGHNPGAESEVGYGELCVAGVRTAIFYDIRQPHNGSRAHAVINKN